VSGVSLRGGLFKGVEFKLESLRSLAAGGINFATPNDSARPVGNGQVFPLHAEGRREWLNWAPRIPLTEDKEARDAGVAEAGKGVRPEAKSDVPPAKGPPPAKKRASPGSSAREDKDSPFPRNSDG
jgi:hypothetical protein